MLEKSLQRLQLECCQRRRGLAFLLIRQVERNVVWLMFFCTYHRHSMPDWQDALALRARFRVNLGLATEKAYSPLL
jgi:hypothetical protein